MDSPKSTQKRIYRTSFWNRERVVKNGEIDSKQNERNISQKRKISNTNNGQSLSKSPKLLNLKNCTSIGNAAGSVWFDDVDPELLEPIDRNTLTDAKANLNKPTKSDKKENFLTKPGSFKG